jgi:hypothetical protein
MANGTLIEPRQGGTQSEDDEPCRDYYETYFANPEIGYKSQGGSVVYEYCNKNAFFTAKPAEHVKFEIEDPNAIFILCKKPNGFNNPDFVEQYLKCKHLLPKTNTFIFVYEATITDYGSKSGVNCFKYTAANYSVVKHKLVKPATIFDPIDESKLYVETKKININKLFDFFVTKVTLLDEQKKVLDTVSRGKEFLPPSRGKVDNDDIEQFLFYNQIATQSWNDARLFEGRNIKAYAYINKQNIETVRQRYVQIEGVNYNGTKFDTTTEVFPIELRGMEKAICFFPALKSAFKIESNVIDIDFIPESVVIKERGDMALLYFTLDNAAVKTYYWGSGAPAGSYTVIIKDKNSPEKQPKIVVIKKSNRSNSLSFTINSSVNNSSSYIPKVFTDIIKKHRDDLSGKIQALINQNMLDTISATFKKMSTQTQAAALKSSRGVLLNIGNAAGTCLGAFPATAAAGAMFAGICAGLNILKDFASDPEADEIDKKIESFLAKLQLLIDAHEKLVTWNIDGKNGEEGEAELAIAHFISIGGKADEVAIDAFYAKKFRLYEAVWHREDLTAAITKIKFFSTN